MTACYMWFHYSSTSSPPTPCRWENDCTLHATLVQIDLLPIDPFSNTVSRCVNRRVLGYVCRWVDCSESIGRAAAKRRVVRSLVATTAQPVMTAWSREGPLTRAEGPPRSVGPTLCRDYFETLRTENTARI
jgi:hypothetical protein